MSYIINPYRYGPGDDPPSGDYVTISTSATVEEDMYDSDYKYFVIDSTTSSAFTVTNAGDSAGSDTIEVYLIAGGGGGGASLNLSGYGAGSGGGAGGYLRELTYDNGDSLAQVYDVTIGAGGAGGLESGSAPTNGEDSVLTPASGSVLTADGGGYGGYFTTSYNAGGGDGGSGGGAGYGGAATGYGTGIAGQGYHGGGPSASSTLYNPFCGGGGAGAVGEDGGGGSGAGGVGVQYEWMDDSYNMLGPDGDGYFAGGGGGGGTDGYDPGGDGGSGGGGGGGGGEEGTDGAANSGGGGGGGGNEYNSTRYDGGAGGSGYLIIRWKFQN